MDLREPKLIYVLPIHAYLVPPAIKDSLTSSHARVLAVTVERSAKPTLTNAPRVRVVLLHVWMELIHGPAPVLPDKPVQPVKPISMNVRRIPVLMEAPAKTI